MKYLVALDFSKEAEKALNKALQLCKENDEVILVSVAELYEKTLMTSIQVDFDFQILDEANEKIMEETESMFVIIL